jgi:hypothetical protein
MLHINHHIRYAHEVVLRKAEFLCGLRKKTKIGAKISCFVKLFLRIRRKMSIFHEIVRAHIKYEDIHVNIFLKLFNIFKSIV